MDGENETDEEYVDVFIPTDEEKPTGDVTIFDWDKK